MVYKDIKNLHIGVYPPAGRVRVASPKRLNEDRIRLAVIQRLHWIKQQQLPSSRQRQGLDLRRVTRACLHQDDPLGLAEFTEEKRLED